MPTTPGPLRPAHDFGSNAFAAALTFAIAVGLFTWLGHLADQRLGTTPLLLIVGFLLGAVGGMLHLLARVAPSALPFGKRRGSDSDPGARK